MATQRCLESKVYMYQERQQQQQQRHYDIRKVPLKPSCASASISTRYSAPIRPDTTTSVLAGRTLAQRSNTHPWAALTASQSSSLRIMTRVRTTSLIDPPSALSARSMMSSTA